MVKYSREPGIPTKSCMARGPDPKSYMEDVLAHKLAGLIKQKTESEERNDGEGFETLPILQSLQMLP